LDFRRQQYSVSHSTRAAAPDALRALSGLTDWARAHFVMNAEDIRRIQELADKYHQRRGSSDRYCVARTVWVSL
jgi:hypothetical protein